MPNRLANSTSPYLLQHKDNPVDWFPWCDEAFEKARREDKPVFLSVGYSSCHWCHVMERESFENPQIAAILNEHFVSIKVDREERPDIDQIYMQAVQLMTGSGGWPMSVFMTPDGRPFFAGTYWPPESRWGRPGFAQVLRAVADAWQNKRDQIEEQGARLAQYLRELGRNEQSRSGALSREWIDTADRWLLKQYDARYGGFGQEPKFPQALDLALWLELEAERPDASRRRALMHTLEAMARGGIFDCLGGGFARYSVDARWLVPHFEKMLYDNALLTMVYADAFRLSRQPWLEQVVRQTVGYVMRDLRHPEGGFFSSEDADSEGVEGKFYVWSRQEIIDALGEQLGGLFAEVYGVTDAGNFEGANILHLAEPIPKVAERLGMDAAELERQMAEAREKLFAIRAKRVRPGRDEKVLLSWNGLMVSGLVHAFRALGEESYLQAAQQTVEFLRSQMRTEDGQLWHVWKDGRTAVPGFLEDYAYLLEGLIDLFQVDARPEYLQWAIELADRMLDQFADPSGGFYFTSDQSDELIARPKDAIDSSVPSANASAARGLLVLGRITGENRYEQAAHGTLRSLAGIISKNPGASAHALRALNFMLAPPREAVLITDYEQEPGSGLRRRLVFPLLPTTLVLAVHPARAEPLAGLTPLLAGRTENLESPRLFICSNYQCDQPYEGERVEAGLEKLEAISP